ncbi:MAG: DUF3795 domain-containing protein [Gemmatimonadetes bacterium]|nr:DUF3795 domain-containing protein [Gemmatimonadota bacterium]
MDKGLAYCGLPCDTCPIHLATLEQNESTRRRLRAEIARVCTEEYALPMDPLDVSDCDGCRVNARLFSGCRECPIRPCAAARHLESCAFCHDYPCLMLQQHFAREPQARTRLEQLRHAHAQPSA